MTKKKEKEEEKSEQVISTTVSDNGHKQPEITPPRMPEDKRSKQQYRPIGDTTKWKADNWLFDPPNDDNLIMRTRLNLKEVALMSSEIMHEEAINPYRDRLTMPLSKIKRLTKMKALLSLDGQSRDEAVGLFQAKEAEDAAKAAFD